MKILFVSPLPPPSGGITRWTTLVTEYAKDAGDEVAVVNTSPKNRGVDGRTKLQRVLGGVKTIFSFYSLLKKQVKSFQPEVVHICTSGSLAFFRDYIFIKYLKKRGIAVTYHLHFGTIPKLREKNGFWWRLAKANCKNSEAVISMNSGTYNALKDVMDGDRLYNLPNPVSLQKLPVALEYDKHKKYILYLGWIIKEKGIEELLTAWRHIKSKYPEWSLKIIGPADASYMEELSRKELTQDVDFCGELEHSDAMEYMKYGGIFVLASYSEGFPNVIIEAMALKVPVVATSVGSIEEMLGGNGVVVEPENSEELTAELSKIIDNYEQRNDMSSLLFDRVVREYELAVVYKKYKSVWEKHKC